MTKLATICYLDNGKEFLLLLRNKKPNDVHKGKYIGVGGKLEAAETPEECAVREIFEETGLQATKMEMKGIITFPEFTPGHDWYTYVFRVTEFSGELIDSPEGTLEWVPYDEILEKPSWEGDRIFLEWILGNEPFFSAKFNYEAGEYVSHKVEFYGERK